MDHPRIIGEPVKDLGYYDGPLSGLVKDDQGKLWFAVYAGEREGWWRSFLLVPADGVSSGREALKQATVGYLWDWFDEYLPVEMPVNSDDYVGSEFEFDGDGAG